MKLPANQGGVFPAFPRFSPLQKNVDKNKNLLSFLCIFSNPLLTHLSRSYFIWRLSAWPYKSLSAMDMVHFLCCNPGFRLVIRRNGDPVLPTLWRKEQEADSLVKKHFKQEKTALWFNKNWFTSLINSPVYVKAPVILPGPSRWTLKLCWTLSLFSILQNTHIVVPSSNVQLHVWG